MITIENFPHSTNTVRGPKIPRGTVFAGTIHGKSHLYLRCFDSITSLHDRFTSWVVDVDVENYQPVNITITVDGPANE